MKIDTLAAIDIGSNAIRILISNIERYQTTKEFKKIAFIRVPVRLGEDVFTKGKITAEKQERLCEAMQGFSHIMKSFGVIDYRACATSAMREASNGAEVTAQIFRESGINIEIITGQEEADTIYAAGGLDSVMDRDKNYVYVDVGGGSTELVVYSGGTKVASSSFKLGTVRMLADAVDKDEMDKFKSWLKDIYKKYAPIGIIASGGNINKCQRLLGKKDKEAVNYTELKILYETLKELSYEERIHNMKLNTYRADVILPALKIFLTVSKVCKINDVMVPRVGLVDGVIHQLYSKLIDSK